MPSFTPPIVANTDFSQWNSWETVTTPDGSATYYVIPGYNGQYVFDPFTSDATGSITIYQNPKPAYDAAKKVQKQQEDAGSTSAQIAQIGGTVAGAGATAAAVNAAKTGSIFGSSAGAGAGAGAAAPAAPQVLSVGASSGGSVAGSGAGSGGAAASGGSAFGGMGAAGAAGIAAALYAGYVGYSNYRDLKKKGIEPGEYTEEEWKDVAYPDVFGVRKALKTDEWFPEEFEPLGNLGPLGPLGGSIKKAFTGGKNDDQKRRDRIREYLEKNTPIVEKIDGSHHITLADGSKFNIGRDGKSSFKGMDGEDVKYGYEADWSNPLTGYAAGTLNPLISMLFGDKSNAFENQLINASVSNASSPQEVLENIRHFYGSFGFGNKQEAYAKVDELVASEKIPAEHAGAYKNALNQVFDANFQATEADIPPLPAPSGGKTPSGNYMTGLREGMNENQAPAQPPQPQMNQPMTPQQAQQPQQQAQTPSFQLPRPQQEQQLPMYKEGAGPGQYQHPDGVNKVMVGPDGSVTQTLIGVYQPPQQQQPMSEEEKVKQQFADMINGNVRKGVGQQPNVFT